MTLGGRNDTCTFRAAHTRLPKIPEHGGLSIKAQVPTMGQLKSENMLRPWGCDANAAYDSA